MYVADVIVRASKSSASVVLEERRGSWEQTQCLISRYDLFLGAKALTPVLEKMASRYCIRIGQPPSPSHSIW